MDPNISNFSQPSVSQVPSSESATTNHYSSKSPFDKSELEKSMAMAMILTAPMNNPILPHYDENSDSSMVAFVSQSGSKNPMDYVMAAYIDSEQKIIDTMLENWAASIKEMEKQVRELLASPTYQAREELRLKGDPASGNISGIASSVAAFHEAKASTNNPSIVSMVQQMHEFEKLPPSARLHDPSASDDPTKAIIIPLTASMLMGGALAIGTLEVTTSTTGMSSNPAQSVMEYVHQIQPTHSQILTDAIPVINLMIMPLVYASAWEATFRNVNHNEKQSAMLAAQSFAKNVIKMVNDPSFLSSTVINLIESGDKFSSEKRSQLSVIIKLILSTVALSLLYSAEVGKAMGNKFGGMEPQEFLGMLNGEIPLPDVSKGKLSEADQAKLTLIKMIKGQLDALPAEQRLATLEGTFEYLSRSHDIDDMTDPAKVYNSVFASNSINHGDEMPI